MLFLRPIGLQLISLVPFLCLSWSNSQSQQAILQSHHADFSKYDPNQLNFSSPAPHIFSSLRSLLQQWPNTFFPNGHSIVPCEIPSYTILYHGRPSDDLPPSPEFLAFDIEMAYAIMGNGRNSHMLTYQTMRPVRCLYFDGQSAALTGNGAMDAQMVFLYGNTTGPEKRGRGFLSGEYDRAKGLCNWAKTNDLGGNGWGIEGIVRMNAGFEMMWCNFSSPSLRLITHLNVTAPLLPEKRKVSNAAGVQRPSIGTEKTRIASTKSIYPLPTATEPVDEPAASSPPSFSLPDDWRNLQMREPFLYAAGFEWFRSATWHYGSSSPGSAAAETRVKPLTCGFLTYYDPQFRSLLSSRIDSEQKSLNLTKQGFWKGSDVDGDVDLAMKRLGKRRRFHNMRQFNATEASLMDHSAKQALVDLNGTTPQCSGMDWTSLTEDIVQRYSKPTSELAKFLGTFAQFNTSTAGFDVGGTKKPGLEIFLSAARIRCHAFLLPYLEYPQLDALDRSEDSIQIINETWSLQSPLGQATFSRCRYHYTRLFASNQNIILNPQESLLVSSIEEVLSSICATILTISFDIERIWFTHFNINISPPSSTSTLKSVPTSIPIPDLNPTILSHTTSLSLLTAYLSWLPETITCPHLCAWDETCHIPIWPLQPIFAPVPPSSNSTQPRWPPWHRNGTGPPGRGGRPGYGYGYPPYGRYRDGEPPWAGRNRSYGYGGNENLPPRKGGGFWMDLEDGLWEPRCVKIQDAKRDN